MEIKKRGLELEHSDTLSSMVNLAFILWSLYLKNKAIELMSQAIDYYQKMIGSDHYYTIKSILILYRWQDEIEK